MPDTLSSSDPAVVAGRHLAAGRVAEAKAIYEDVLQAEPGHVRALCGLGAVALKGGETARALELVGHAVAIAPNDGECVGNLGVVYLARNELAQAEDCLSRALDLAPDRAELHANMASLYLARGDAAMALVAQRRAVELAPEDAGQAFNLANALAAAGRTTDAVEAYEAVLALLPGHVGALNNLSVLHKQAGDLDAAEALLAEARLQDPLNPELLANHADLLLLRGRREEALATMKCAAGLAPGDPRLRAALGSMLLELGRLTEAATELATAMRAAPSDAGIALTLARLLRRQGRLDAAQTTIERVAGLAAEAPAVHALAAELLLLRGRYEEAWDRLAGLPSSVPLPEPDLSNDAELTGRPIRLVAVDAAASLFAARFLPVLAARGAKPVVLCPPLLAPLLETVSGVAEAVPSPHLDLTALAADGVPTMLLDRLPLRLRATPERWPAAFPVFAVASAPAADAQGGRRIGIWWEGAGPGEALPAALCGGDRVALVSLQTGPAREQACALLDRQNIVDRGEAISDYRDLAVEIAGLDVVIASDGPVAHLAAGLGVETWVLVDRDGSCYWPAGGAPSPWYPNSRSFAQAADGSWTAALEALRAALVPAPAGDITENAT